MMTHEQMQEALMMVDDPELRTEERQRLLSHLDGCGECAELVRQWRVARGAFAAVGAGGTGSEASEAFVQSVMRRLPRPAADHRPAPSPWRVPAWLVPQLGVALAGVALALAVAPPEPSLSTETLLLAQAPEDSSWEFSSDTPDAALLLGITTETETP
jgi:anti-sigma factor RsiW